MPPENEITRQERIAFGCPQCSYPAHNLVAIISYRSRKTTWSLYPLFQVGQRRPKAISSKRCPTPGCNNVFRVTAEDLKEMVWASGRAE